MELEENVIDYASHIKRYQQIINLEISIINADNKEEAKTLTQEFQQIINKQSLKKDYDLHRNMESKVATKLEKILGPLNRTLLLESLNKKTFDEKLIDYEKILKNKLSELPGKLKSRLDEIRPNFNKMVFIVDQKINLLISIINALKAVKELNEKTEATAKKIFQDYDKLSDEYQSFLQQFKSGILQIFEKEQVDTLAVKFDSFRFPVDSILETIAKSNNQISKEPQETLIKELAFINLILKKEASKYNKTKIEQSISKIEKSFFTAFNLSKPKRKSLIATEISIGFSGITNKLKRLSLRVENKRRSQIVTSEDATQDPSKFKNIENVPSMTSMPSSNSSQPSNKDWTESLGHQAHNLNSEIEKLRLKAEGDEVLERKKYPMYFQEELENEESSEKSTRRRSRLVTPSETPKWGIEATRSDIKLMELVPGPDKHEKEQNLDEIQIHEENEFHPK